MTQLRVREDGHLALYCDRKEIWKNVLRPNKEFTSSLLKIQVWFLSYPTEEFTPRPTPPAPPTVCVWIVMLSQIKRMFWMLMYYFRLIIIWFLTVSVLE